MTYKEHDELVDVNYDAVAQSQLKRFTEKLNTSASKVETKVWPFDKEGAIYELCFKTTLEEVVCSYGGAAKMPQGQLTFVAFAEGEKQIISEMFDWILSVDVVKP